MSAPAPGRKPRDDAIRSHLIHSLETGFAVGAGAGTGKTRILVNRIVALVDDGVELGRIVAITFTDRAASELRERVRLALEKEVANGDEVIAGRRAAALAVLDLAPLTTIHGYCRSLLAGRPIEAGISPGFRTLDALEADLLLESVIREHIERLQESDDPVLEGILLAGGRTADLRQLVRSLRRFPDLEPASPPAEGESFTRVLEDLLELARSIASHEESVLAGDTLMQKARDLLAVAETITPGERDEHDLALCLAGLDIDLRAGAQKNWKAAGVGLSGLKAAWKELRKRRDRVVAEYRSRQFTHLLDRARAVLADYGKRKQELGALDFDDLLLLTRNLLGRSEPARKIRAGIDRILVDEFQDTDPVQVEIVLRLAGAEGPTGEEGKGTGPVPGRLFIVGDANQSIYRFRRADLAVFDRARTEIAASGEEARLTVCFRSSPALVAAANDVFGELLPEASYTALAPFRCDEPNGPAVSLLDLDPVLAEIHPDPERKPPTAIVRRAEARALAGWITEMRAADRVIFDPHTQELRDLEYSDVTVLVRSFTGIPVIEDELAACGIPYRVAGGRAFFARLEIAQTLPVLRAIAAPDDAVACVAALRSPCFGVSDEDLVRHVAAGGTFRYLNDPESGPPPGTSAEGGVGGNLQRAFSILSELHGETVFRQPSAIVRRLFDKTRVIPLHALKPDGERRMANLLKLLDLALTWEEAAAGFGTGTGVPALRGFVEWLAEQQEAAAEEESPLSAEGDSAVSIMTMHGAKGLEFPVVAILDLAYRPGFRDRAIPDRERGTVHLSTAGLQPLEWEERREEERLEQEAEALRLQYVAFTRARDHVVMASSRSDPGSEKAFLAPLVNILRRHANASAGEAGGAPEGNAPRPSVAWMIPGTPERRTGQPHRLPRSFQEPSGEEIAAAVAGREADLSAWAGVVETARRPLMMRSSGLNGLGVRYPERDEEAAGTGDVRASWYARLRGTRVHEAMELVAGFGYGIEAACRTVSDPGDPDGLAGELPGLVEQGSALLERARAGGWRVLGAEWPLVMGEPARALPGIVPAGIDVLTGTADLILADAEGNLCVVDYKTGQAEAPGLLEQYRAQLAAYAALLREATARRVTAEIWALSSGERVCIQEAD